MKQQLHIQVPTPCHENWDIMNPVEKGRFCASCSKQVVDFTMMTDTEILGHLKQSSGNTCGRFSNDQLNRALIEPPKERKTGWKWLMATISSVLLFTKLLAQGNTGNETIKSKIPAALASAEKDASDIIVGKIKEPAAQPQRRIITGKIIDEKGNSIPYASVGVSNKAGTLTDEKGNFSLGLPDPQQSYKLVATAVGFVRKEINVYPGKPITDIRLELAEALTGEIVITKLNIQNTRLIGTVTDETTNQPVPHASIYTGNNVFAGLSDSKGRFDIKVSASGDSLNISAKALGFEDEIGKIALKGNHEIDVEVTMKPKVAELPAITVISYPVQTCTVTLGMVSMLKTDTTIANLKDSVAPAVTKTEPITPVKTGVLNIYPNPVYRNTIISIVIPEKGEWKIQLVDNNGVLVKTDNASIGAKNTATHFRVPGNITTGMYYIRLVNRKGETAYTGKLVVQ